MKSFPRFKKILLGLFILLSIFQFSCHDLVAQQIAMEWNYKDDMTGDIKKQTARYPIFTYSSEFLGNYTCKAWANRVNSVYELWFTHPFGAPNQMIFFPNSGTHYLTSEDYVIIKFSDGSTIKLYHIPDGDIQEGFTYYDSHFGKDDSPYLGYKISSSAYALLTSKPLVKIRFTIKKREGNTKWDEKISTEMSDFDISNENQKTIQQILKALKSPIIVGK